MQRCLHFDDDWEETDNHQLNDIYVNAKHVLPETANPPVNFAAIKDAHKKCWGLVILFDNHHTFGKIRCAGWYKARIMIGLEPKLICTSATNHLMRFTFGPLESYKVQICPCGGQAHSRFEPQNNLHWHHKKVINLPDEFMGEFKHRGRFVAVDSAYMGVLIALVAKKI